MSIADTLTKPVGPLPLGAWIVVVGAGLGIGSYAKRKGADSAPASYVSSPDDGTTTAGGTNTDTVGNAWATTPGQGSLATEPLIATNEDWRTAATRILLGKGYGAGAVTSALTKYLQGLGLSNQEYALVESAIGAAGPTPYMVQAPTIVADPVAPNPTPTPAPAPTPQAAPLPSINHGDWDFRLPGNADIFQLGTAGPGGWYSGVNVGGGAPQYALINGEWVQNFDWNKLAPGTKIGTPGLLKGYAGADNVTVDVTP